MIFLSATVYGQPDTQRANLNKKAIQEEVKAFEKELIGLTEAISRAAKNNDRTALERLLADGFLMTSTSGKIFDKTQTITLWAEPNPDVSDESFTISDAQVLNYGDTAIVMAVITDKWREKGAEKIYRERIFDVWQRKMGKWRLIASKPNKANE